MPPAAPVGAVSHMRFFSSARLFVLAVALAAASLPAVSAVSASTSSAPTSTVVPSPPPAPTSTVVPARPPVSVATPPDVPSDLDAGTAPASPQAAASSLADPDVDHAASDVSVPQDYRAVVLVVASVAVACGAEIALMLSSTATVYSPDRCFWPSIRLGSRIESGPLGAAFCVVGRLISRS